MVSSAEKNATNTGGISLKKQRKVSPSSGKRLKMIWTSWQISVA